MANPSVNHSPAPFRAELVANWLFKHFSSWRSLVGLAAIAVLTGISVTFNYQLGKLMGSDQVTKELFPLGFAMLDFATLFLASWLTRKSRSVIRKFVAWLWLGFLVSLSVWAAMSFTLASDARLAQSGYEQMKEVKLNALEQAEQQVDAAQINYQNTSKYKQLRLKDLREAQMTRDELMLEVTKLNEATPHVSLAIYYRTSALLHSHFDVDVDPQELSSLVRMLWALALTLSPFILTGLLAFEISSTAQVNFSNKDVQTVETDFHDEQPKMQISPGENSKFSRSKWPNFTVKQGSKADLEQKLSEDALNTGKVGQLAVDNEALKSLRKWLQTQEGRVTRSELKYRSGNASYEQVSLLITELIKEGRLERMANGQMRVKKSKLRIVGS